MNKQLLFIVVCLLLLSGCSMQKRLYTKGFYTHKNTTLKAPESIVNTDISSKNLKFKIQNSKPENKNLKSLTANSNSKNIESSILNLPLIDGCDTIVLKSGATVLAMINEINLTKILFRNCNSSDETVLFLKKSDVSYINFANGSKQVFDTENNNHVPQNLPGDRNSNENTRPVKHGTRSNSFTNPNSSGKLNTFSLISFIISVVPYPFLLILFALFGLVAILPKGNPSIFSTIFGKPHLWAGLAVPFVFVVAALALSIIAIYQIKTSNSENKKGLKLAYIALILSLILLILLLLFTF